MSIVMTLMLILAFANFGILLSIFMERFGTLEDGIDGIKMQWAFFLMNLKLLFKRQIIVKPHLEYYSRYQATENFYLLKIYVCSHERFFKLISGNYTTIVPERGIIEIDGKPIKTKL